MLTADQALNLSRIFVDTLEREYVTTKKMLEAVPADQLGFKLGDKGRTTSELVWHIAASEAWFGESIAAGQFPMEEAAQSAHTKAEILAWYDKNVPAAIVRVKAMTGEALAAPINFYNVFNMPAVMYLQFWNSHSIHHRGQLSTYLRAMNAHVPSIYGGSADEPFQMPATA